MTNDVRIDTYTDSFPLTADLDNNGLFSFKGDLGGATPKLAIFIGTNGVLNDTETSGAQFWVGATDGTNQWACTFNSNSAQGTTRVGSRAATTLCFLKTTIATNGNAGDDQWAAAFSSFSADTVTLHFTTTQTSNPARVGIILMGGADFSCKVGVVNSPTLNAEVLTTVGFQLSALICSYIYQAFNNTGAPAAGLGSFGIASYDGSTIIQKCKTHSSRSAVTTTETGGELLSNRIAAVLNITGTTLQNAHELTTVSATQFGVTSRTADPTDVRADIGYIAMKFGTLATKVKSIDFPTSAAADWTVSGVGFAPKASIMIGTTLTAEDSVVGTGAGSVHCVGAAAAMAARTGRSGAWSMTIRDKDADTDTNPHGRSISNGHHTTAQTVDGQDFSFVQQDGTAAFTINEAGLYQGFNSDGFTVPLAKLSHVMAGPVKGAALFIANHAPEFETAMSYISGGTHLRVSGKFDQDCTIYLRKVTDGSAAPTASDLVATHDFQFTSLISTPWIKGWLSLPNSTAYDVYATAQNHSGQLTTATKIDVATVTNAANVVSRTVQLT